jgi:hypothetical protein
MLAVAVVASADVCRAILSSVHYSSYIYFALRAEGGGGGLGTYRISNQSLLHGPLLTLLLLFPLPWRFFAPIASMLAVSTLAVWAHTLVPLLLPLLVGVGGGVPGGEDDSTGISSSSSSSSGSGSSATTTIDDYCVTAAFYSMLIMTMGFQRFQYQQARAAFRFKHRRQFLQFRPLAAKKAKAKTAAAAGAGAEAGGAKRHKAHTPRTMAMAKTMANGEEGDVGDVYTEEQVVTLRWINLFGRWYTRRHTVGALRSVSSVLNLPACQQLWYLLACNLHSHLLANSLHSHSLACNLHSHLLTGNLHSHSLAGNLHSHSLTGTLHSHLLAGNLHSHSLAGNLHLSLQAVF